MEEIMAGIRVKKTNVSAKTVSKEDTALRMDAERIIVSFFSGQYKYRFSQTQGVLESSSPFDIELTISLNGNNFIESHAFDIKDQIERFTNKRANVRIVGTKGKVTVA